MRRMFRSTACFSNRGVNWNFWALSIILVLNVTQHLGQREVEEF